MNISSKARCRIVSLLALICCSVVIPVASAATISATYVGTFPANITGTLPNQDTALLETFTLASAGSVTITTTSYLTGGFQTNLLLFSAAGNFITAGSPFGAVNPSTMIVGDSRLMAVGLAPGNYILALSDFLLNQSLTATSLRDGFTQNDGNRVTFVDENGNQRTGNYAVSIVTAAAVPEPSTLWLVSPFLAAAAIRLRKRRQSSAAPLV